MKVWVFVAQCDGEAVGPFVFSSKPSDAAIEATLLAWNSEWTDEDVRLEVYRRQLTEEEVITVA